MISLKNVSLVVVFGWAIFSCALDETDTKSIRQAIKGLKEKRSALKDKLIEAADGDSTVAFRILSEQNKEKFSKFNKEINRLEGLLPRL